MFNDIYSIYNCRFHRIFLLRQGNCFINEKLPYRSACALSRPLTRFIAGIETRRGEAKRGEARRGEEEAQTARKGSPGLAGVRRGWVPRPGQARCIAERETIGRRSGPRALRL